MLIGLTFTACRENKAELCKCIEIADEVNQLSASFFNRPYSELGKDSLDLAIEKRDEICAKFQNMREEELQAEKENCSQLNHQMD